MVSVAEFECNRRRLAAKCFCAKCEKGSQATGRSRRRNEGATLDHQDKENQKFPKPGKVPMLVGEVLSA